jgi:hypothetical protein
MVGRSPHYAAPHQTCVVPVARGIVITSPMIDQERFDGIRVDQSLSGEPLHSPTLRAASLSTRLWRFASRDQGSVV